MPLLTEIERQEIESDARNFASFILGLPADEIPSDDTIVTGYINGATVRAEIKNAKIAELSQENDRLYKWTIHQHNKLESKDSEIEELKRDIFLYKDSLKEMTLKRDHWINISNSNEELIKRYQKIVESRDHELAQLKDVIKTVIIHLQQFDTQDWFDVFGEDKFRPYKILNKLQDAIANKLELK